MLRQVDPRSRLPLLIRFSVSLFMFRRMRVVKLEVFIPSRSQPAHRNRLVFPPVSLRLGRNTIRHFCPHGSGPVENCSAPAQEYSPPPPHGSPISNRSYLCRVP